MRLLNTVGRLVYRHGQWIDPEEEAPRYAKYYRQSIREKEDAAWVAAIIGAGVGGLLAIAQIYIGFLIG